MRIEVANADLHVFLESSRELYQLVPETMRPAHTLGTEGLPLEKGVIQGTLYSRTRDDLSAKVTLKFVARTSNVAGIDVTFSPPDEFDWSKINQIGIHVAYSLYHQLAMSGQIVAPYLGDHRVRIKFSLSQ